MPFKITGNKKNGYKLLKIKDNTYINKTFKTKESAINVGFNYIKYRKKTPYLKGSFIMDK